MRGEGPYIILVRPQLGENIGMVARAMLNCGLTQLRLVNPRDPWPNPKAHTAAAGAQEVLEKVRVFETTQAAIADLTTVYATTNRRRDMEKPLLPFTDLVSLPPQTLLVTGFMFGAENSGLSNADIVLSDAILTIPVNRHFPSMNLAQAVFALCHQFITQTPAAVKGERRDLLLPEAHDLSMPAPKEELLNFYDRLESLLNKGGFFYPLPKKEKMQQNLRNFFQRAKPSSQELQTLHGVIRCLSQEPNRKKIDKKGKSV